MHAITSARRRGVAIICVVAWGYPSVNLASTYALIAYALRNRGSVDHYLAERAGRVLRHKPSSKCDSTRLH